MKKSSLRSLLPALVVVALLAAAAPARAQEAASPPPATAHTTHFALTGLGVGAAAFVSGMTGPQVVYDFGAFHLEGLLGFDRWPGNGPGNPPSTTVIDFGVSGWYHLHMGERSDFSLGGGFGFMNASTGGNSGTAVVLEPGMLVRAFITSNVALHARVAISMVFGDDVGDRGALGGMYEHFGLAGQLVSGFGFTYFFR
jgi:hypothetical protein